MATQLTNGRAFEWAVGLSFSEQTGYPIEPSRVSESAQSSFECLVESKRIQFKKAADRAVRHILQRRLVVDDPGALVGKIRFNSDAEGQQGDVRDVMVLDGQGCFGVSCKTNHEALKHPRLSNTIDFVKKWGLHQAGCSSVYWNAVNPVFSMLSERRRLSENSLTWEALENKAENVYWPILDAWEDEIWRVSKLGSTERETLTSGNAVIPIAYYLYQIGAPRNFVGSETYVEDRSRIAKWLKVVLIKRIFGGQPDNVLLALRNLIRGSTTFPYNEIIEESRKNSFAGGAKSMAFALDDIRNLLEYEYGEPYTYSVLSFLYPNLDFRQRFHQDHIFPRALFKRSTLLSVGLSGEQVDFCQSNVNSLANLQLLEGIANQEKSQTAPDEWIGTAFRSQGDRDDYRRRHLIPDLPLTLSNFSEFVRQREELISSRFCEELL